MLENIVHKNSLVAIIIRSQFESEGIQFLTPDDFSQQLAYMKRPQNYSIQPHIHNSLKREVFYTKEVLFIKSGSARLDLYDEEKNYLESRILKTGDVVLLASGGHGFEILDDCEIIEVKQGPYAGEMDKERFEPVDPSLIKVIE